MLPPVEPDEQLVAQGVYQQLREGQTSHLQELWTLHGLFDGALIWRSQLLYDGIVPVSACYLLRDPSMTPLQMVFYWRWQDGVADMIEYRFYPRHVTILYQDMVQDMILPAGYEVYGWHTATENMLWLGYNHHEAGLQSLQVVCPGIHNGTLWPTVITVDAALERREIMPGPGGPYKASAFDVYMPDVGPQSLYFDEYGIPVCWRLPDDQFRVDLIEYSRIR